MNVSALSDLRNLLGKQKGKEEKSCGICGKPNTKNTSAVAANCPAHAAAQAANLPAQYRVLEKALGDNLTDFVVRKKFNAQLETIRQKLEVARAEHDAYQPVDPAISDRKLAIGCIMQTLADMGVEVRPNTAEGSDGKWSLLQLAEFVQLGVAKLLHPELYVTPIKTEPLAEGEQPARLVNDPVAAVTVDATPGTSPLVEKEAVVEDPAPPEDLSNVNTGTMLL